VALIDQPGPDGLAGQVGPGHADVL
jgi:hypothetical protein